MVDLILVSLGLSLVLYGIFGGADFGAGALEWFKAGPLAKEHEKITTKAMGPVWEANHMWIILAVVILFNGFPRAYAFLSIAFHIPLTLMLLGIVLRGTAFAFRHYDPSYSKLAPFYSLTFSVTSCLCPLMMGVIAGASLSGRAPEDLAFAGGTGSFYDLYLYPWLHPFAFSLGFFFLSLCIFVGAIFLIGETDQAPLKQLFVRRARVAQACFVLGGGLVFAFAWLQGIPLLGKMLEHPVALLCLLGATVSLPLLWGAVARDRVYPMRFFAASQVCMVILGWYCLQYPYVFFTDPSLDQGLSFYATSAPPESLRYLAYALGTGALVILPSLIFLLRTFKWEPDEGAP